MIKSGIKNYNQSECVLFIKYLGCWRSANQEEALETRSPSEYRALLKRILELYSHRNDDIARWTKTAARAALRSLGH